MEGSGRFLSILSARSFKSAHARRTARATNLASLSGSPPLSTSETPSVKSFSSEASPPQAYPHPSHTPPPHHHLYPFPPPPPPPTRPRYHHKPRANPWNFSKLSQKMSVVGLDFGTQNAVIVRHTPARATIVAEDHALMLEYRLSPGTRVSTSSPTRSRTALHRKSDTTLYAQLPIRYAADLVLTHTLTVPLLASAPSADSSVSLPSRSRSPTSRTPLARSPALPAAH